MTPPHPAAETNVTGDSSDKPRSELWWALLNRAGMSHAGLASGSSRFARMEGWKEFEIRALHGLPRPLPHKVFLGIFLFAFPALSDAKHRQHGGCLVNTGTEQGQRGGGLPGAARSHPTPKLLESRALLRGSRRDAAPP